MIANVKMYKEKEEGSKNLFIFYLILKRNEAEEEEGIKQREKNRIIIRWSETHFVIHKSRTKHANEMILK